MIKTIYFKNSTEERLDYLQEKLGKNTSATVEYAIKMAYDFFKNNKLKENMSIESVCEFLKSFGE